MTKRKRSAKVYVLPGVERRDLVGPDLPTKEVFDNAQLAGVTNVVLVGYDRAGELYVAGSGPDMDKSLGMLMRAVELLTRGALTRG